MDEVIRLAFPAEALPGLLEKATKVDGGLSHSCFL
jgi:hypothetical protein